MYFSVKSPVMIAGKVYTPCICYALPEALAPTINKMVKEGKAYTYNHKVAFQNGKVLVKAEETVEKKDTKKAKKGKEEEIPSPEEIAEGF